MNKNCRRGISLIEIMLSMGILAVIMLPVFMTFSSGNMSIQVTEAEFRAHTAALELMEQIVSLPFNLIRAGSFDAGKIHEGGSYAGSPVVFRVSADPELKSELKVEEIKRDNKVIFKKITVKVLYPAARNSEKKREFTLKTLVANENI